LPGFYSLLDFLAIMPRHSDILMDHMLNPRNVGRLKSPNAVGQAGKPGRGVFMVMHFRVAHGIVTEVKYQTFGCGPAIAAGSMLTEMITGRSIEKCMALTGGQLSDALGGLPPEKTWCAGLAVEAMRDALSKLDRVHCLQAGPDTSEQTQREDNG
jgi:NifU-like protein involved in Fe-S cluster formation